MERQEQLYDLRTWILKSEADRLHGAKTMSIAEAGETLKKMSVPVNADAPTKDEMCTESLAWHINMDQEGRH